MQKKPKKSKSLQNNEGSLPFLDILFLDEEIITLLPTSVVDEQDRKSHLSTDNNQNQQTEKLNQNVNQKPNKKDLNLSIQDSNNPKIKITKRTTPASQYISQLNKIDFTHERSSSSENNSENNDLNEMHYFTKNQDVSLIHDDNILDDELLDTNHKRTEDKYFITKEQINGQELRALRKERNLKIDTISRRTFIKIAHLRAIEADLIDELPEEIFVRGFLKKLAKFYHINEDSLVSAYMKNYHQIKASN